jgi:eukaryotic-like serine/threonine-protein kinase
MTTVFQQIGPYRIVRQIGHGGMAVVFLAVDTRFDRQVALKLVQHATDGEAREIVDAEKFGAELQKQFSDRGAHVPAVYEYGIDEDCGYFYVAMEYLDGENLSELITRGALPAQRAVDIAIELARFLDDAHAFEAVINGRNLQSLLHLDLKPRNVRITSSQQVKVLDFGTAKALSLSRKVTRNDFGSVAYLSPERLETGEVDAAADLWALGVVLYEMVCGMPPFQAADTRRLERLILSRRPPAAVGKQCPVGLAAIVAKLLDPRQAERYASAREIRQDLERFKAGEQTVAQAQGWPGRAYEDEATRRTSPVAPSAEDVDSEKTRRTVPPPLPPVLPPPLPPKAVVPPAPPIAGADSATRRTGFMGRRMKRDSPRPPRSKSSKVFRAAMMLIGLGLATNEISVANDAGRTAHTVATRDFDTMPAAWQEYERLSERSHLGMGIRALQESLIDRTLELVRRVTDNYLTPSPTVREAQWIAARDSLVRALGAVGGDNRLSAALRYCEGHLLRINGEAKKARGELEAAQTDFTEAVVAFRQAAEFRRDWPDPFIGLARTFILGLEDVESAADALEKARLNGYELKGRDAAQLADGYRARGNALARSARQLSGLPQERQYLDRAAEAYRLALEQYANAGTVAGVPQNVGRTQRALVEVEETLGAYASAAETTPETPAAAPDTEFPVQGAAVFESTAP